MSRSNPVPVLVAAFLVIGGIVGIFLYHGFEFGRVQQVENIRSRTSGLYAQLIVKYDKPPIGEEHYWMQDYNGSSTYRYRITPFNGGRAYTIYSLPRQTYDVSFFFGKLVQDEVWSLTNRPPRGDTSVHYTVYVKQIADGRQGDRTITFTDPKWIASKAAGRQFQIDLSKTNPNDALKLQSTSLADTRYLTIVDDFRAFGPDAFRLKIAQARARVRGGR